LVCGIRIFPEKRHMCRFVSIAMLVGIITGNALAGSAVGIGKSVTDSLILDEGYYE